MTVFCPRCQAKYEGGFVECLYCHAPLPGSGVQLYNFDEVHRAVAAVEKLRDTLWAVNDRPPGWHNKPIQLGRKLFARLLLWNTRPLLRALAEIVAALEQLSRNMVALDHLSRNMLSLEQRLMQSETRSAVHAESIRQRLELLHQRVAWLTDLQKTAALEVPAGRLETEWNKRVPDDSRLDVDTGMWDERTAYIIGLFGTGRSYLTELLLHNMGERSKYVRDTIRLHPGPTPMIYSGHATIKYVSREQHSPAVMGRILEAVRLGYADLIFLYRHPLDSLLTNWVWWRTYVRDRTMIKGISLVYRNIDDLCALLEQNFEEFKSFAEGDPDFFASLPGPRFLSFSEFVEETELHCQSATLALRFEDFIDDPFLEFSKIVELILGDRALSRISLDRPKTTPYRYLAVQKKVPRFRNFVDGLSLETKRRIEKIGYGGEALS
jgi:hypothetical protein